MTNNQYKNDELPNHCIKTMSNQNNDQRKNTTAKQDQKHTKQKTKMTKMMPPMLQVLNDQYPKHNLKRTTITKQIQQ